MFSTRAKEMLPAAGPKDKMRSSVFFRFRSVPVIAHMSRSNPLLLTLLAALLACGGQNGVEKNYDPLKDALESVGKTRNMEAVVPPQCYTKTEGVSNPCWTCHTDSTMPNYQEDFELQETYSFSAFALENRWENLFADRSKQISGISDREVLEYVKFDNYSLLKKKIESIDGYRWWVPDLDFTRGFDTEGFSKDGSWWRAIRYKPFLGTFWPTNGNIDDVFIRLPDDFMRDERGNHSREIYKINLAILELLITCSPDAKNDECQRRVEPINEELAGIDLDRNGRIKGHVEKIRGIPPHYVGKAKGRNLKRYLYPEGTEFLHTVRYIDPENPSSLPRRMKEVRYSKKVRWLDQWALLRAYEEEAEDKQNGILPKFKGSPPVGLQNDFGWQLQGFIEDGLGRLRLQTEEEHRFCMGCHSALGASVDQTFTLARKVPGKEGWRHQDLNGIKDVPQAGHAEPEILTYFRRVSGGDEFRENDEILEKFFPNGKIDEKEVLRASAKGDLDITHLIVPSRERALLLNKAYMALVREQSFEKGRDTLIRPPKNVHRKIENGSTGLKQSGRVYYDGSVWLDWGK